MCWPHSGCRLCDRILSICLPAMKLITFHFQKGVWYNWNDNENQHLLNTYFVLGTVLNVSHGLSPLIITLILALLLSPFRKEKTDRKFKDLTKVLSWDLTLNNLIAECTLSSNIAGQSWDSQMPHLQGNPTPTTSSTREHLSHTPRLPGNTSQCTYVRQLWPSSWDKMNQHTNWLATS